MDNIRRGNKQLIKELNRALVVNTILNFGPIYRTKISDITDLGLSTVSNIVADLIKKDLIYETGEEASSGGRRPILLEFNCNDRFVLGIKIGLDGMVIGLINMKSQILDKVFTSSPVNQSEATIFKVKAAQKGDVIAKNIFQEVGRNLGIGVVNLISLFDPEIIAVGGEGAKAGELIFHPMRELVINNFPQKKEIKIVPLQLGEDGWLIGAAELVLSEVFKNPIFKSQGKVAVKSVIRW